MYKHILLSFVFIILLQNSFSQESSKKSLTYSAGLGFHSQNNYLLGVGAEISFGYKYGLKNSRLSIYPLLSIGSYISGSNNADRDKYFNTATLNILTEYDLFSYKSLVLTIDAGLFAGLTKGLYGTGTEFQSATSTDRMFDESNFINKVNYGFLIAPGIRMAKSGKRAAISFIPLSMRIGTNDMLQLNSLIQFDIRL